MAVALALAPNTWAGVVAFSSDRCPEAHAQGCTKSLWTVADDGSGLTRITGPAHLAPPGEASFDDEPSWSPDGRLLLYRRALHSRPGHGLWITSLDGASLSQVGPEAPNDRFQSYDGPEWSPDGRWVVFGSRPADAPRTEDGNGWSAIWLMSIDGTEITQLTVGSEGDDSPSFSPDGRRIAFVRGRIQPDASGQRSLVTMNLDGTDVAPVFVGTPPGARASIVPGSLRTTWSPDGRQFAQAYLEDLYTLRSDGTQLEWRGRTGTPLSIGGSFSRLQWSAEPAAALIYDLPMEGRPLQRLELSGTPAPARPLIAPPTNPGDRPYVEGDQDPDWRASAPLAPVPDVDPPVVLPIDSRASAGSAAWTASRRGRLSVRKRTLRFLAVDSGGVRRVDVAIARKPRARGAARPVWRRVRGTAHFTRMVRRLRPGRYRLRMRAVDGFGNRTRRPAVVHLRLRR